MSKPSARGQHDDGFRPRDSRSGSPLRRIDTQSDESSPTSPSTERQFDLLRLLVRRAAARSAPQDVRLTDYGAVLATIPATVRRRPTIAFLAHVDTAPQFNATGVKPIVHRAYDGGDIVLPDAPDLGALARAVPLPRRAKVGDDIVTASGTTLLGADDKAGVAIIMTVARHLLANPEHRRTARSASASPPTRRSAAACTPTCRATSRADVAYTLDGGDLGEIVFETFSADKAMVTHRGRLDPSRARPRTSWSTPCTSPPRSSTPCRRPR